MGSINTKRGERMTHLLPNPAAACRSSLPFSQQKRESDQ